LTLPHSIPALARGDDRTVAEDREWTASGRHRTATRPSGARGRAVPEISLFLGIVITMHQEDHQPPHFHARYAGRRAVFSIEPLQLSRGRLPPRVVGLVMEWAARHRLELLEDWDLACRRAPLKRIPPLE
jgi:hypothetical protein